MSGIWLVEFDAEGATVHVDLVSDAVQRSTVRISMRGFPRRARSRGGSDGDGARVRAPPRPSACRGTRAERPPYLVLVHGGPTGHEGGVADAKTLFFTSRGIGVWR
jgi:hypothetical protein